MSAGGKRAGSGRKAGLKKVPVGLRMDAHIKKWLDARAETNISLIEKALIEYYDIKKPE